MHFNPTPYLRRPLASIVCLSLLTGSLSAPAQSWYGEDGRWPQPTPQQPVPAAPVWRNQPQFTAPSATHCARPIQTREMPGHPQGQGPREWLGEARPALEPDRHAAASTRERTARAESGAKLAGPATAMPAPATAMPAPAAAPAPAAPPAPTPGLADTRSASAASEVAGVAGAPGAGSPTRPAPVTAQAWPSPAMPQPAPHAGAQRVPPRMDAPTAGMVDDNADFNAYLAFRDRTPVQHLARDIRERYLLQVTDAAGHAVPDAEVAVQARSGHAMWARTDTAGRTWVHPDAFDPARSDAYRVLVRRAGVQGEAWLHRGQKSAVDVRLPAALPAQRAQLDLVFLIDATGSMADEIARLRATLKTIVADVARMPSQPDLCLGLVAYRDRGDAFLWRSHDLTNDVDAFQRVLDGLRAGGGGDYPEAMSEALHETVHRLSWRAEGATRMVVLLADAPPHLDYGGPRYDDDMMSALGKGIKLFSVGASGLDRQGEYIQRQIAQYTGGRFVFLTYAQASQPSSGNGRETVHDVSNYSVDTLDRLIVRLVGDELARLQRRG